MKKGFRMKCILGKMSTATMPGPGSFSFAPWSTDGFTRSGGKGRGRLKKDWAGHQWVMALRDGVERASRIFFSFFFPGLSPAPRERFHSDGEARALGKYISDKHLRRGKHDLVLTRLRVVPLVLAPSCPLSRLSRIWRGVLLCLLSFAGDLFDGEARVVFVPGRG